MPDQMPSRFFPNPTLERQRSTAVGGSGVYYNGTITNGIALTNPATQNPITIDAVGYVTNRTPLYHGAAIYGDDQAFWTLVNFGTVAGNGTLAASTGVQLTGGGVVTNGQSVSSSALITGYSNGIQISGMAGTVVNSATVSGIGVASAGVYLAAGGYIGNTADAVIAGGSGISLTGGAGSLINSGTVRGRFFDGLELAGSADYVGNKHNGVIAGKQYGVLSYGLGTTIVNSGTIQGTGRHSAGIDLRSSGYVANNRAGLIAGGSVGLQIGAAGGTVTNRGFIQGDIYGLETLAPATVVNLGTIIGRTGAVISGTMINDGTVTGTFGAGVALQGAATLVDNGAIAASTAVSFGYGGSELLVIGSGVQITGSIENFHSNDTIDLAGVVANAAAFSGGVLRLSENGTVVYRLTLSTPVYQPRFGISPDGHGGTALTVSPAAIGDYYGGTILTGVVLTQAAQNPMTIGPNGYITRQNSLYGGTALYGNDAAAWAIINLGRISGSGSSFAPDGIQLVAGGSVVNGHSGSTTALITASWDAIQIAGATATVVNYGTITGGASGIDIAATSGTLVNSGTVTGGYGVKLKAGGSVRNAVGAMISATSLDAILVSGGAATIANAGTILAAGTRASAGVAISGDGYLHNAARGLITATYDGVDLEAGNASVTNAGSIHGSRYGLNASAGAVIVNFGVVTGGAGISLDAGTLVNTGTIAGTAGNGVSLHGASTLINTGHIGGAGVAVSFGYGEPELLQIGSGAVLNGALANFGRSDTIALTGIVANGGTYAGGALTLTNNGIVVDQISLTVAFAAPSFGVAPDGSGGTAITVSSGAGGSYYDGTVTSGIVLNSAAQNPLIIGPNGYITRQDSSYLGTAIYGTGADFWTIGNLGTIKGNGGLPSPAGIRLAEGGLVINGSTGSGTALIAANEYGVDMRGAPGTVVNYATIAAAVGNLGRSGVVLNAGGNVDNASGGLIAGYQIGIKMGGPAAATVSNFGTIQGSAVFSGIGMDLYGAGDVVTNYNEITGLAEGMVLTAFGTDGRVFNRAGARIVAETGINAYATSANIENSGTIDGTLFFGIILQSPASGTITNSVSGLISGYLEGVDVVSHAATVSNAGTVTASGRQGRGIVLLGSGTSGANAVVVNAQSGLVAAPMVGVEVSDATGTVVNYGNIAATAAYGYGIKLTSGRVTNFGTVAAGPNATAVYVHYGVFYNYGLVIGRVSGIRLALGGGVNGGVTVGGTVAGATGISVALSATAGQTLTVGGTVIGTSGTAVSLTGGSDRLILAPGAAFQGLVDGGGASALEVAAGLGGERWRPGGHDAVAYVSLGNIVNFSSLEIDSSAAANAYGVLSFDTLINQGLINIGAGQSLSLGVVAQASQVGVIDIRAGGRVHFEGAVAAQTVYFHPPGGTAAIDHPESFAATIAGFEAGDAIDLASLPFNSAGTAILQPGNVLQVSESGATFNLQLDPNQGLGNERFALLPDGSGGTLIETVAVPPPNDFDGDGRSEVLWRNSDGTVAIWATDGTSVTGAGIPGGADPAAWQIRGTGDFDGDGRADVLWQTPGGLVDLWQMNGTAVVGGGAAGAVDPAVWRLAATGDFDGDGRSDILWQASSGLIDTWQMNGAAVIGGGAVGIVDASWHIRGVGDFNGDGRSDVLWQNDSGVVDIWELNGTSVIGGGAVGVVDASWHIRGVGDFNGDGRSDILWQNDSGVVDIWELNGTGVIGGGAVGSADPSWQISGVGDYNGDGRSDILWRHDSGLAAIWELNGTAIVGNSIIGAADPAGWAIVPPDNTGVLGSSRG